MNIVNKIATIIALAVIALVFNVGNVYATEYQSNIGYMEPWSFTYSHNKTIKTLKNAEKGDRIHMHIDSTGGEVDMMFELLKEMKRTKGKVTTHVHGKAYSAAAIIALAGHRISVEPNSEFMFHIAGQIDWFWGIRMPLKLDHPVQKRFVSALKKYTFKYLTGQQERHILKGNDVYVSGKDISSRR